MQVIERSIPRAPSWVLIPAAAVLTLAAVFLASLVSVAGGMLELAELVSHPEQYDRQMVAVTGRVTTLRVGTTREGDPAYGFLLQQGENLVKVLGLGHAPVRKGEYVMVEGVFHRLRRAGRSTVYNEINASLIRSLDRLHPDLVG